MKFVKQVGGMQFAQRPGRYRCVTCDETTYRDSNSPLPRCDQCGKVNWELEEEGGQKLLREEMRKIHKRYNE